MARWIIFLLINDAENYSTLFFSCCLAVSYKAENHFLSTLNVDIFYVDNEKKMFNWGRTICDGIYPCKSGWINGQFYSTANVFNYNLGKKNEKPLSSI